MREKKEATERDRERKRHTDREGKGETGRGSGEKPREPFRERRWKILQASERERAYVRER